VGLWVMRRRPHVGGGRRGPAGGLRLLMLVAVRLGYAGGEAPVDGTRWGDRPGGLPRRIWSCGLSASRSTLPNPGLALVGCCSWRWSAGPGETLGRRGGHEVVDAIGADLLLEGDFEVLYPLPVLPISGENPKASAWAAAALRRRPLPEGAALGWLGQWSCLRWWFWLLGAGVFCVAGLVLARRSAFPGALCLGE
jgi:hypothetical protein